MSTEAYPASALPFIADLAKQSQDASTRVHFIEGDFDRPHMLVNADGTVEKFDRTPPGRKSRVHDFDSFGPVLEEFEPDDAVFMVDRNWPRVLLELDPKCLEDKYKSRFELHLTYSHEFEQLQKGFKGSALQVVKLLRTVFPTGSIIGLDRLLKLLRSHRWKAEQSTNSDVGPSRSNYSKDTLNAIESEHGSLDEWDSFVVESAVFSDLEEFGEAKTFHVRCGLEVDHANMQFELVVNQPSLDRAKSQAFNMIEARLSDEFPMLRVIQGEL